MAALPVTIAVKNIKCLIETDEVGADEPYVLVTAIDLKTFPLPTVEVTLRALGRRGQGRDPLHHAPAAGLQPRQPARHRLAPQRLGTERQRQGD